MHRVIGVFILILFNTTFLLAQQLNCSVVINAQKVTNTNQQLIKNLEIAEKIKNLYVEMKQIFTEKLSSKWAINALDYIFTNPIFRNNNFTTKSGIAPATAQRFSRILLEENLITTLEEASGRRSALYSFEPLMQLVRV